MIFVILSNILHCCLILAKKVNVQKRDYLYNFVNIVGNWIMLSITMYWYWVFVWYIGILVHYLHNRFPGSIHCFVLGPCLTNVVPFTGLQSLYANPHSDLLWAVEQVNLANWLLFDRSFCWYSLLSNDYPATRLHLETGFYLRHLDKW